MALATTRRHVVWAYPNLTQGFHAYCALAQSTYHPYSAIRTHVHAMNNQLFNPVQTPPDKNCLEAASTQRIQRQRARANSAVLEA